MADRVKCTSNSTSNESKLVLVCLKKRKRAIKFTSNEEECDSEVLKKRIKEEFKDCLPTDSQHGGSSNYEIILQVKDAEWDEFVDIRQEERVEDKSVVQVEIVEKVFNKI